MNKYSELSDRGIICSYIAFNARAIEEMCLTGYDVEELNDNELEDVKERALYIVRYIEDLQGGVE